MSLQVIAANGTSQQSSAIQGDKVKVTTSANGVFYAVGANPVAYSNSAILPANSVRFVNMRGIGNKIAILQNGGASNVSVETCATISSSTITILASS